MISPRGAPSWRAAAAGVLLLILIALGWWRLRLAGEDASAPRVNAPPSASQTAPETTPAAVTAPATPTAPPSPATKSAVPADHARAMTDRPGVLPELVPPSTEDVRAVAERNPERTAPSVIRFAAALSRRMDAALASEDSAGRFFPELEACAANSGAVSAAETARVLCLSNAGRLAARYPSLHARYENLESRVETRILRLLRISDLPAETPPAGH